MTPLPRGRRRGGGRAHGRERVLDLALGIVIGLVLGLGVVAAFVFLGSEGSVDAPRLGAKDAQAPAASSAPSQAGRDRADQ